ncbi:MAG: hypothetical protein ACYDAY_04960 [Candidatus Dormibacteria bacterium]
MSAARRRRVGTWPAALATLGLATVIAAWGAPGGGATASPCPPGQVFHPQVGPRCQPEVRLESGIDSLLRDQEMVARNAAPLGLGSGAVAGAYDDAGHLASEPRAAGAGQPWTQVGTAPLMANGTYGTDTQDPQGIAGLGWVRVSGRVQGFAQDPATPGRVFAAVANGGVWEARDVGTNPVPGRASWRSIGDGIPTQMIGSVAYSPEQGGTVIAGTGDEATGSYAFQGLGVWRSLDDGRTWQHAAGVPDAILTFRVAVDPTTPATVYAATSQGLYRSTDDAASFTNVGLPTGTCAGHVAPTYTLADSCFFANVVTDVAVQDRDEFGDAGGRVIAAVGWRYGQKLDPDGSTQQSPQNGIYTSAASCSAGATCAMTFVSSATNGYVPQANIGRVALALAHGPQQKHTYVYSVVQDAAKLGGCIITDSGADPTCGQVPYSTTLYGAYVSADFGQTWTLMESAQQFGNDPTSFSALVNPVGSAEYSPGVQSWYNLWVEADPTLTDPTPAATGAPTRVLLGLEEVWETKTINAPVVGSQSFRVIGRYWNACDFELSGFPCPQSGSLGDGTTSHPDQHAALMMPTNGGGVTLVIGSDGGAYWQRIDGSSDFSNGGSHPVCGAATCGVGWGDGANDGLYTTQPYDAEMSGDGTVVAGLQDNGEDMITPDGVHHMVFGGDGFYTAIDPANSRNIIEEYTVGNLSMSTDGGNSWTSINPSLTSAIGAVPFAVDPLNPKHVLIGGRDIEERNYGYTLHCSGSTDPTCAEWNQVFDLGTTQYPGQTPPKTCSAQNCGASNALTAEDVLGDSAYVGFCGYCSVDTGKLPFGRGIATNVGGSAPPRQMTSAGWHIAAAHGLPTRFITSLSIDPADANTIYVTLGGYGRRWIPPGAYGDDVTRVGTGHVFRSTDHGEDFTDMSANLPDAPANWVTIRNGQLIVATQTGVYLSTPDKSSYSVLGYGLPGTATWKVSLSPDHQSVLAATYGRGVYRYNFPTTAPAPSPGGSTLPNTANGASALSLPDPAPVAVWLGAVTLLWGLRRRWAERARG